MNAVAQQALDAYESGGIKQVTEEEVEEVKTDYEKYQKHWRSRRRACLDIVNMICENLDLKSKEFFEQVGLEADEDYSISLVDFPMYAELNK
jgi:hypothetical protein